jgi:hypothetical protein
LEAQGDEVKAVSNHSADGLPGGTPERRTETGGVIRQDKRSSSATIPIFSSLTADPLTTSNYADLLGMSGK